MSRIRSSLIWANYEQDVKNTINKWTISYHSGRSRLLTKYTITHYKTMVNDDPTDGSKGMAVTMVVVVGGVMGEE